MSNENRKYMRILVFFDLPTQTPQERKIYTMFRRALLKDGYTMLQFSVYCRICNAEDTVDKHLRRIKSFLPRKGSVRLLQITDKQYQKMLFLVGKPKIQEKNVTSDQMLLF